MLTGEKCEICGRTLHPDEIAATKKLINRGAVSFRCVSCLAAWFEVKPGDILEISFGAKTVRAEVLSVQETVKKDDAAAMYREIQ